MNDFSIQASGLTKVYNLYESPADRLKEVLHIGGKCLHQEYRALDGISFSVRRGETFGIIGTNGAGKSTLLKIITGVTAPTSGEIRIDGKISALLELGAGFNSEYTGLENIYLNGMMSGRTRGEMKERVRDISEFADIGDFLYQPVKTYSSGMFARLAFAVAINVKPDILIVDEALSVGDAFFQNKCYRKFEELRGMGITVLFVSHDIATVKQMCSRVLWIEHGVQQMLGDSVGVCNAYSNSILGKRAQEFSRHQDQERNVGAGGADRVARAAAAYQKGFLEPEDYPMVSYSKESILDDEVEIVSAFFTNAAGDRVWECDVNQEYRMNLVFRSKRVIKSAIAGFVMETVKGLWVINTNSAINGLKAGFEVAAGSLTKVEFSFTMPAIMNGDYVCGVAVSEGNADSYRVLTWLYGALYVRVNNSARNSAVVDVPTQIRVYERGLE